MSAPRTKRQFAGAASDPAQRQITSFFQSAPSSSSIESDHTTSSRAQKLSTTARLPESVQANLISVGMRVRKSVPEGYKTGTYSVFSLWDETDASVAAATMGEGRSRANAISTPRELLPFCGIHKVGGLGTQSEGSSPDTNGSAYRPLLSVNGLPLDHTMSDDVPGLTSSQETVNSTDSVLNTPPRTRKRSYAEDEDDGNVPVTPDRLNVNSNAWRNTNHTFDFDGEISPRSFTPPGWNSGNDRRFMPMPRKGRHGGSKLATGLNGAHVLDQENYMMMRSAGGGGNDFDEADFLDTRGDWEVEMRDA